MNMIETASWQLELRQGCFSVLVYFGTLTGDARTAHSVICFPSPCQMNLEDTRHFVVRAPGCDKECTVSKTNLLQLSGTTGFGVPVETSRSKVKEPLEKGTSSRRRLVMAVL